MYFASLILGTFLVVFIYILFKLEDKLESSSRLLTILFFILFLSAIIAIFIVPDILSHHYTKQLGFSRFYLAQMTSFTNFAMGAGWIFIGPIIIPLTRHGVMPSFLYYGTIVVSYLGYSFKRERGLALILVLLISISFVGMEYARRSTRDFQTTDELRSFLAKDSTDAKTYTSNHKCIDFTTTLMQRARDAGYRLYFYSTYIRDDKHARCEAYIVAEDKWVEVEPQTDEIL